MERTLVLHCTTIATPQRTAIVGASAADHVLVHFATVADLLPRILDLSALLDKHEQDRAERFVHAIDRERYVLGHGYLREVLGSATGHAPEAITFQRGRFGKPTIDGSALHFNFSDTKDAVLVGIAHHELGVDIETMARRVDHERVAQHYFTPEEIAAIQEAGARAGAGAGALSVRAQSRTGAAALGAKRMFLDFWTRKEAVLKASGVGIMDDLRALRVDARRNEVRIAHDDFVRMAAPEYHVRSFAIGEEHLVSLATAMPSALSFTDQPLTPPRRTSDGS